MHAAGIDSAFKDQCTALHLKAIAEKAPQISILPNPSIQYPVQTPPPGSTEA